jgi:hypothetical protein
VLTARNVEPALDHREFLVAANDLVLHASAS